MDFGGIKLVIPVSVYAPQEDSFLLATAVKRFARGRMLDVGTGSGIQAIVAAKKKSVMQVVATDVSQEALACAKKNAVANGVGARIYFLESSLFAKIKRGIKFDTIVFNPPYLPTAKDEHVRGGLDKAFDGGITGRNVMDEFIAKVKKHLAPGGIVLLVSSSLSSSREFANGNEETIEKLRAKGFSTEIVGREKFFFEELVVIKAKS